MLIDECLDAPKDDCFIMMTQQSDCCHDDGKDGDGRALRQTPNFLNVNSARRRKNNQNRVSWHNSYTQKSAETNNDKHSGEQDDTKIESDGSVNATLNFRSMAMADVGSGGAAVRTLAESNSTSSPSLFVSSSIHNPTTQTEITTESQKYVFSAPIADTIIFSFNHGRHATSAEILPAITETPPRFIASDEMSFKDLEPESSSLSTIELNHSAITNDEDQRRRSISYIKNPEIATTAIITNMNTFDADPTSGDIQHKRSVSDHVIPSTTFAEERAEENTLTAVEPIANQLEDSAERITGLRHLRDTISSITNNTQPPFPEASTIDNRLSTSTPSINDNAPLCRDNPTGNSAIRLPKHSAMFSSSAQSFGSNHQYKTALLNSAAEVRCRNGVENDLDYPSSISSTISNGTFFKSSSQRNSLRRGMNESEGSREILKELRGNASCELKRVEKSGKVSISNLVDRFTSRRQNSDGNLRRLFANVQNASTTKQQTKSKRACCDHTPMTSGSRVSDHVDDKANVNRRSFKWRSLFSTHKGNSIAGNKENWNMAQQQKYGFNEEIFTKSRLKKSISLSYAVPTINLPERSHTLTPLVEDTSLSMGEGPDTSVRFRRVNNYDDKTGIQKPARPFSVIGSTEHDSLIILQHYKINEENDRKFLEFLREHELDPNETLQSLDFADMTRSVADDSASIVYLDSNICCCEATVSAAVEANHNISKDATNNSIIETPRISSNCPRHGIRRRNSSEKQTPVQRDFPHANQQSLSAQSNYYSLSRRRNKRMLPQSAVSGACRVGRRPSISSTASNAARVRRTFSPTSPSPSHYNNNGIVQSNMRGVRIQKRRIAANRRRSSINVNQVLTAIHQQQRRQQQNKFIDDRNDVKTYGSDTEHQDMLDNGSTDSTAAVSNSDANLNESAGRDALKAIIMRQHSMKQAAKTKPEELKWRKMDRSVEKEKKRESKSNSVILGTLLSIRQKKKPKDTRNLANVFPFHPVVPTTTSSGIIIHRKDSSSGLLDNRRSTHLSFSEKNGSPDVLNNVVGGVGTIKDGHTFTASSISPGFDTPTQPFLFDDLISSFPSPRPIKQRWQDLDLWTDEPGTWSSKHPDVNLPAGEKKRQNVIYEIYITEKHHCQVIVFLQQVYQAGLLNSGVMTTTEIKMLVPNVLDPLLDFHLHLLRRIRERVLSSKTVNTISDIIFEEFEEGEYRNVAISAYTNFCLARDEAHKLYAFYMERSVNFKKFFDHYERNPEHKGRSFKSCLLLIAQRLTKYPLLIEQILKLDSANNKSLSQRAHNAVKSFALKVDSELWLFELNRRWEGLKKNMDKSSIGQLLGAPFSYDDLNYQSPDDPRKLLSINTVHWQSVTGQKIELSIVIFDDIVALLYERNGVMQFFSQQDHASIIPLHTALIREMERTNEVMLIVLVKKKPDMYRLVFNNKTDMHNWITTFKKARLVAPHYVRTSRGVQHIDVGPPRVSGGGMNGDDIYGDPDEIAYNASIQRWQKQLEDMFRERVERESLLQEYFVDRLRFFDALRHHLKNFPSRIPRSDSGILPATTRVRENRDIERMKSVLRARLNDLKDHRRSSLNQLVETAQKARDSDVSSFFDELYADNSIEEMHHESIEQSRKSSPPSGVSPNSSLSSSSSAAEEGIGEDTTRAKRCKPRRARTYHGTADSQKSSSSSSTTRRHTTVPKVGPNEETSSSMAEDYTEQVEEEISRLPLRVGSKARRAATDLILENVSMRIENNKLRNEIALQDLHIASLRVKKTPVVETTEKLESLRQKHEEIQTRERDFRRQFDRQMDELNRQREQLERREAELEERESQLKIFAESAATNFNIPPIDTSCEANGSPIESSDSFCERKFSYSHPHQQHYAHAQRHASSSAISQPHGGGSSAVPLANRSMTNLYGKLANFRSGSVISDLGSVKTSSVSNGYTERSSSTLPPNKPAKSPVSELAQVPRHLAVKTETKPVGDKRRKK